MLYLNERERLSLRRISLSSLCVVMGEDMWRLAKGRKESSQNVGDPRSVPFHTVAQKITVLSTHEIQGRIDIYTVFTIIS